MLDEEQERHAYNESLLTKGDDSIVKCDIHRIEKRWGDLNSMAQLAVLDGIDFTDECILEAIK